MIKVIFSGTSGSFRSTFKSFDYVINIRFMLLEPFQYFLIMDKKGIFFHGVCFMQV